MILILDAWRLYLIIKEGYNFISEYQRIIGINSVEVMIAIWILLGIENWI